MTLTDILKNNDASLEEMDEPTNSEYKCFNTGGVETVVGEFLYGLIRMTRPDNVFETGTHLGVSSSYIGRALKDNGKGMLTTLEINRDHIAFSKDRWSRLGIREYIVADREYSLKYFLEYDVDIMLLDSEPEFRFKELLRFYDRLAPGGYVFIHDTPRNLCQGNVNTDHPEYESWPFGNLPKELIDLVLDRELYPFHFGTPRGLIGFYKRCSSDYIWEKK